MTPQELERLILRAKDSWELQAAFAHLDEKTRAKLSSTAQHLHRQLHRGEAVEKNPIRNYLFPPPKAGGSWNHGAMRRATLALFALGPISAVKTQQAWIWREEEAVFDRIIRDRRPAWIDDWITYDLEQEVSQLPYPVVHAWIRDGVCHKPTADRYYALMAWHLTRSRPDAAPLSEQLLAEPDLLDDLQALFRVPNPAFDTSSGRSGIWSDALAELSAAGHLDRDHLLDMSLAGLSRELDPSQLRGLLAFYKRMAPGAPELQRHQQQLLNLLCHPVGHVARFAIDMLAEIAKDGAIDAARLAREVPAFFSTSTKANAVALLKLIGRIASHSTATDPHVLEVAGHALRHRHADVQAMALDFLEAHATALERQDLDALVPAEPHVAASNRARLSKLIMAGNKAPVEEDAASDGSDGRDGMPIYAPISAELSDHCVLSPEDALTPIASVGELIDAIAHAVEVVDSPDDIERIIDAISRLAHDRPPDFGARAAPVLHRIGSREPGRDCLVNGHFGVSRMVLALVKTWLSGRPDRMAAWFMRDPCAYAFQPMMAHLRVIAKRVAQGKSGQLLSAPTHKGGWIDPLVWADRLHARQHEERLHETMDFRLSLVRLAPDHRAAALDRLASVAGPSGRIARFALGGDERPGQSDHPHYAAWISAARCRAPHKDWSREFAALDVRDNQPDGLRPARYGWHITHEKEKAEPTHCNPVLLITTDCAGEDNPPPAKAGILQRLASAFHGPAAIDWDALPTSAATCRLVESAHSAESLESPWVTQWLSHVWPQNPAAACMTGAVRTFILLENSSSDMLPNLGFLHALFQRNRPWDEPAHLLLCLGLLAKGADMRGLAVDALIEGIEGGRFVPGQFASVMTRLGQGGWVKVNRPADALMAVVPLSGLHAAAIGEALQHWLPGLDFDQKGLFRLLEVLVEARAAAGQSLNLEAREALGRITGSGKSAKLAKQLLSA